MSTMLTTNVQALATDDRSSLVLQPLLDTSIAARAEVAQVFTTGSTTYRVPVVRAGAAAKWTAEGEEILPSGVDIDEVTIVPSKVAGLIPISRELAEDSAPSAIETVGHSLANAIIWRTDEAFFGNAEAPGPAGLAGLSDVHEVDGGTLDNLDPLLHARTEVAVNGGTPTAILAHPRDVMRVAQLKDSEGSNRALIEDVTTVLGLPVIASEHATEGTLWVIDSSAIATVVRDTVTVESSRDVFFSSDRVAVKATARVGFGFIHPEKLAKVNVTA
ncbi:phage major capsid protein [Nesterenkonia marinintestina]|uniref:phage major capsid protein n=1 Tax=Nesterenkonia marinintestina TaxID=2979865 RepID=UPI0021C15CA4|nr:phage major capsid protein [Nesterenkonia sp. GX14115]